MSTTEAARHHLIERAVEVLGREAAMTLADHLPPTGWADVATTSDLRAMEERLDARFDARFTAIDARFDATDLRTDDRVEALTHQLDGLRHELLGAIHQSASAQTRVFVFAMISTLASVAGIALGAAQLAS